MEKHISLSVSSAKRATATPLQYSALPVFLFSLNFFYSIKRKKNISLSVCTKSACIYIYTYKYIYIYIYIYIYTYITPFSTCLASSCDTWLHSMQHGLNGLMHVLTWCPLHVLPRRDMLPSLPSWLNRASA